MYIDKHTCITHAYLLSVRKGATINIFLLHTAGKYTLGSAQYLFT